MRQVSGAIRDSSLAFDLFNSTDVPINSFEAWATHFNQWACRQMVSPRTLVGYSLGGRLALHALASQPELWSRIIIVAAHPGLQSPVEKAERLANDESWAQRFIIEEWSTLLGSWNSQGVFAGSVKEPERREQAYSRESLAKALRIWSLANQGDLRQVISDHQDKITWVVGERDEKFKAIAVELKAMAPKLNLQIVKNSGHRVLFDAPQELGQLLFR